MGSGGVFEIEYNGEEIFSKRATGRFPDEDELIDEIQQSEKLRIIRGF
jgi:selT/selW/selH-like putative selenoprotein